jgi:hypothetical protein
MTDPTTELHVALKMLDSIKRTLWIEPTDDWSYRLRCTRCSWDHDVEWTRNNGEPHRDNDASALWTIGVSAFLVHKCMFGVVDERPGHPRSDVEKWMLVAQWWESRNNTVFQRETMLLHAVTLEDMRIIAKYGTESILDTITMGPFDVSNVNSLILKWVRIS